MTAQDTLYSLKSRLQQQGIQHIRLAGSYARNTATDESDIDILYETQKQFSLLDKCNIINQLEDHTGKSIDFINIHKIRPTLKESILSHTIAIF